MQTMNKKYWMLGLLLVSSLLTGAVQAQLADSPWPMFMHDPQHTNRSQYAVGDSLVIDWTFDLPKPIRIQPSIGEDGTVYLAWENKLYAIRPDGTVMWIYNDFGDRTARITSTPALDSNGNIYVVARDGDTGERYVFAINSKGKFKWKCADSRKAGGALAIAQDGTIYVGSNDTTLFAINANGTLKWKYKTDGWVTNNPTIGLNGKVYVSSSGGYLLAIVDEGNNGRLAWKQKLPIEFHGGGFTPFIGPDGTIYAVGGTTTAGFPLHAFDPDGTLKWQTQHRANYFAVGKSGTIYLSGGIGFAGARGLFALNPEDGTKKWFLPMNRKGVLVIGDNEVIHAGIHHSGGVDSIFAIDSTGNIKKKYGFDENVTEIPAMIIDSDSSLYVVATIGLSPSYIGKLYCLRPPKVGNPDLVFSDVTFDPAFGVTPGAEVKLNFSIRDLSDTTSVRCRVWFYYDDESHFIDSTSVYVPSGRLGHGEIIWDTQGLAVKEYDVFGIITESDPPETDTTNNEAHFSFQILPTIQSRIDFAQPGDTIWVEPGAYFEHIVIDKESLVLKSKAGPEATIIDAIHDSNRVIEVNSGLNGLIVIDGFTIQNGLGLLPPGTVGNTSGGGIRNYSACLITNNIFRNNYADGYGGAIADRAPGNTWIMGNTFENNSANWGAALDLNYAIVSHNIFRDNRRGDGAIYSTWSDSRSVIQKNVFIRNSVAIVENTSLTVENNILIDSDLYGFTTPRVGYNCRWPGGYGSWSYRSIYDLFADPLFVDEQNYDYYLQPSSPCINKGNPFSPRDPDGTRADIGAFYYDLAGQVGTVTGVVIDSTSGTPIWGAKVIFTGSGDEDWIFTGNDGRFQFVVREGTDYSLQALLLNYKPARISDINVSVDGTQDFTLTLSPAPVSHTLYPPRDLTAKLDSLDSSVVHLQWDPPSEELSFDDGIFEYVLGFEGAGSEIGVGPFGPVTVSSTLDTIKIAFNGERSGDSIKISIGIDTTRTLSFPDTTQLKFSKATIISDMGGFQDVDLSELEIVLKKNWHFYVSVEQMGKFPMQIALDEDAPDSNAFIEILPNIFGFLTDWGLHGVFAIRSVISPISQSEGTAMLAKAGNSHSNFAHATVFKKEGSIISNESRKMPSLVTKRISAPSLDMIKSNSLFRTKSRGANASDSLLGYNIYRSLISPVALVDSNRVYEHLVDTTAFSDTTLVYDGTYYYIVRAAYTEGESVASNEVVVNVVNIDRPPPITDLRRISKTDSSATLDWTAPRDDSKDGKASKYEMRYTKVSNDTTDWWKNASKVDNMPTPSAPGTMDSVTVSRLDSGYTYIFAIKTANSSNNWSEISNVIPVITPVRLSSIEIPQTFELSQNYPNPFNPETTIEYQLPKFSQTTIKIYNLRGQLVKTLVDQKQPAGYYSVNWNGKDETGRDVASGVYFFRLRAKDFVQVRKLTVLR